MCCSFVCRRPHASTRAAPDDCVVAPGRPSPSPHHSAEHTPLWQPANQLAGPHAAGRASALVCQSAVGLQERQEAGPDQWDVRQRDGGGATVLHSAPQCATGGRSCGGRLYVNNVII